MSGSPPGCRKNCATAARVVRGIKDRNHPYWQPGGMAEELAADVVAARDGHGMNRLKAWFGVEGEALTG